MGKLKVVSLFSGCGGMDLGIKGGFEFLGKMYRPHDVEIIYAIDNDKNTCETFNKNFGIECVCKDIRTVDSTEIPPHHVLVGGFPCVSFSIVAQNPPRLGYKDERGRLFFEMCRILTDRKPICFIAENVKGLLSANKGKAFPLVLGKFKEAGYHVTYKVLNAADYGVPQKRERVFIVGFRDKKILDAFKFPKPVTKEKPVPLSKVIMSEDKIEEKYYFSKRAIEGLKKANKKMNKGRVQNLSEPCNTIGAHLAKVSINSTDPVLKIDGRYRRFTPREAARIQSFPDDFIFVGPETKQYRAIGNAVPPVLMWYITKEVIKAIKKVNPKLFDSMPYRTENEKRSYNMSKIRGKNTKIELILRRALWSKGYRYRLHCTNIPGKPDIVFKSKKIAIFCDSAFWHGKNYEETISRIKTNREYWANKLKRNIERDKEVNEELKRRGWVVLRFWEDEIKGDLDRVVKEIEKALGK